MNAQNRPEMRRVQFMPPLGGAIPQQSIIGFSTPDMNDRFLRYLERAVLTYAELHDIDYVIADAQNDVELQYRQIRDMIDRAGVQGLLVIPVDDARMEPVTEMAHEANIPLVYLNRRPYNVDEMPQGVYFVGSDPANAGALQADFLAERLDAGNLAILMGTEGLETTIGRTAGLENELQNINPNIQVVARAHGNFFRAPAYEITRQWLAQFGNSLRAIAANNDEMALGAIAALQEAGRHDVIVVGVDGLAPGRAAVQEGLMAATVFQDASRQGEIAVNMLRQLLEGRTPAMPYVLVPHILITDGT